MNQRRVVCWSVRFAATVLVSTLFLLCAIVGFSQQVPQRLHKHVPVTVSSGEAEFVDALPAAQTVDLTIVLPVRNQARLTELLQELYDPSSPQYLHFLSVEEFTDQFGPTEQDYTKVIAWAVNHGLKIKEQSQNRLILEASGTAAQVNAALNISMSIYRDPKENRTFYSADREPTLDLDTPVAHIDGLNNYSIPEPMVRFATNASSVPEVAGAGPGGSYLGSDMRAAYYGGGLLTGAGQCVGLFEFGGYRLSDVNLTFNNADQTNSVPINNVLVNGASGAAGSSGDTEEVADIAQAIGMAPGLSQVRVYIGPSGSDASIFNAMATDNLCKQLSVSWSWEPDDPSSDDPIFEEFATQGQSVFVASGDDGAYDASLSPYFYPAEDDYVTAVGGTHLFTNYAAGPWVAETAWNNPPYGSGGGVSPDDISIPGWQNGVANSSNDGSTSYRNVPDVAMEADFDNYVCDLGACAADVGGTSFAAPRWAGFTALINQQAIETGVAPHGFGFLDPTIYSIGSGANYTTDFHDITTGNNNTDNQPVWYNAVTGYDLVTGWGSPS
jgi:subtilase family serine protease